MSKRLLLTFLLVCSGCQSLSDLVGELRYSWNHEPCDGQGCNHTYSPLMQRPTCPKQTTPPLEGEPFEP